MTELKTQNFGIEIETVELSCKETALVIQSIVGGTVYPASTTYKTWAVQANDGRVWKAIKDGSLESESGIHAEIVSPICTYDDINTIQTIVRAVKVAGAKVNESCGIHVHVGVENITGNELCNLVKIVDKQEEYIIKALDILPDRLENYTKPIESYLVKTITNSVTESLNLTKFKKAWYRLEDSSDAEIDSYNAERYNGSRYHGLNLHATFTKGTVEYRYFNGSLHAGKIKAYIQFCLALTAYGRNSKGAKSGRRTFNEASAKYDFRVFLTSLGLNGKEFESCRLHMLSNFSGDSAFKKGRPMAIAA